MESTTNTPQHPRTRGSTNHGEKLNQLVQAVRCLDRAYAACEDPDEKADVLRAYELAKSLLPDYARQWVGRSSADRV